LGLAIVKDLVEMHGGEIFVESELKRGSRFTFILPKRVSLDFFLKYLKDEIKKTLKARHIYSMVLVSARPLRRQNGTHDSAKLELLLEELVCFLMEKVPAVVKTRLVFEERELYIALPNLDKEKALVVEGEIKLAIKEFLEQRTRLPAGLQFALAAVTCPEDGETAQTLVGLAKKKAAL
jgi:chemotaxis protein histidine kinase CheA